MLSTASVPQVWAKDWTVDVPAPIEPGSPDVIDLADAAAGALDEDVRSVIAGFGVDAGRTGALRIGVCPIGPTPPTPTRIAAPSFAGASELVLLAVARLLGEPVGYEPELGGAIVQNLYPVPGSEHRQVSTSSAVTLAWHTETAFHPDAPHYLLLLCRRGDPCASTRLASVHDVIDGLTPDEVEVLSAPRFRTRPDASFLGPGSTAPLGPPVSVLGPPTRGVPRFLFDADLMTGVDPQAGAALARVTELVEDRHHEVTLGAGDLLLVDNTVAVHGRSAFRARFDGTDRWLQRTFVVDDLAPSSRRRIGRVITTRF